MRIVTGRGTSLASKNSIAYVKESVQYKEQTREVDLANWKHVKQFLSKKLIVPIIIGDIG